MSVTVDRQPLAAESLGLRTVGQVLTHLQRDNRLIVSVLVDGQRPDADRLTDLRQSPLNGHTLYIETADPKEMALEVLDQVTDHLNEADQLRTEACELLAQGNHTKALERLSGCFTTWQHAQDSIDKTAQLLRIDLERIEADGATLLDFLVVFTEQLRQIRTALENRDFVLLNDILTYEMTHASARWTSAIGTLRQAICEMHGDGQ